MSSFTIAAWLVWSVSYAANASQTVTAVPFASMQYCEKRLDHLLAQDTHYTIKPFCTTEQPPFWVKPVNQR